MVSFNWIAKNDFFEEAVIFEKDLNLLITQKKC